MDRRAWIIIIILIASVCICTMTCGVVYLGVRQIANQATLGFEPAELERVSQEITDFSMPSGYRILTGTSMLGVANVMIVDLDSENLIWLFQSPSSAPVPADTLLSGISANEGITWEVVDVRLVSIRGEQSAVTIYQGFSDQNRLYHAWTGSFQGKGGPAAIVFFGPDDSWDESIPMNFINSMR